MKIECFPYFGKKVIQIYTVGEKMQSSESPPQEKIDFLK